MNTVSSSSSNSDTSATTATASALTDFMKNHFGTPDSHKPSWETSSSSEGMMSSFAKTLDQPAAASVSNDGPTEDGIAADMRKLLGKPSANAYIQRHARAVS